MNAFTVEKQETFVQLYRSFGSYEGRSSLLSWTFGIPHNVCSRWMVGGKIARELDEHRVDAARVLDRCGEVLSASRQPAHQEIFHLRYGESHSIRIIASKVGKTNEAVKISLRRSRTAMADAFPSWIRSSMALRRVRDALSQDPRAEEEALAPYPSSSARS